MYASCPNYSGSSPYPLSLRHSMMLFTVNCATSCVLSFVFTMIFGCPCKPLRYSLGPSLSRSSTLTQPARASHQFPTQQIFPHPLCFQFHLTSPRISAHLAEYFCPVHSPRISAPLPVCNKKNKEPDCRVSVNAGANDT